MEINNRDTDHQRNAAQLLERLSQHYNGSDSNRPLRLAPSAMETTPQAAVTSTETAPQGYQILKIIGHNACFGHPNPDIFFPERGKDRAKITEAAKKICAICLDKSDCRDGSLEREEPHGIWGGLTEGERRTILNRRQRLSQRAI